VIDKISPGPSLPKRGKKKKTMTKKGREKIAMPNSITRKA